MHLRNCKTDWADPVPESDGKGPAVAAGGVLVHCDSSLRAGGTAADAVAAARHKEYRSADLLAEGLEEACCCDELVVEALEDIDKS